MSLLCVGTYSLLRRMSTYSMPLLSPYLRLSIRPSIVFKISKTIFNLLLPTILIVLGFGNKISLIQPMTLEDLNSINPSEYFISQKLDGVRAYWDGKNLYTKNGNKINSPYWFTKDLPNFELDGELYADSLSFEDIISIVKNQKKSHLWERLQYHIFEVPNQPGDLKDRLAVLKNYISIHPISHLKIIPQLEFFDAGSLRDFFKSIQDKKGEGIILREKNKIYTTGRDKSALKYKIYFDAECKVSGYEEGKGKYEGKVGSIICQNVKDNQVLKIGSGITDNIRVSPPSIGTIITYKYYQTTKNNRPKHPVFLRIREDEGF